MLVGNVHLVCGDESAREPLVAALRADGVQVSGADAYMHTYATFGVDEARELASRARTRPVEAPRRTFILVMPSMTVEAQNALLKTLEEPTADALFFFIIPSPEALLPTLRSRAQLFTLADTHRSEDADRQELLHVSASRFLAASLEERLAMLAPLLKKDEEDKHDMHFLFTFLSSLERIVAERGAGAGLKSIYRARRYLNDKGSLKKALLEQVALLTPRA